MSIYDLWVTLGDLDLDSEKNLREKKFWLKNIFWDFENFSGVGDPEPEIFFSSKYFLVKNNFWDFENFWGWGAPRPPPWCPSDPGSLKNKIAVVRTTKFHRAAEICSLD